MKRWWYVVLLAVLSIGTLAHEEERTILEETIRKTSVDAVLAGGLVIIALIIFSLAQKKKDDKLKTLLLTSIVAAALITTVYIAGATIYLNIQSPTKGPVHWHADFEVWRCGQQLDLIDPRGLANRVGTPVLHEHGDNRIHVEGVVVKYHDADLHTFFEKVGGSMDEGMLLFPTNQGNVTLGTGECNGKPAKLQVFAYRTVHPDPRQRYFTYEQVKLTDEPQNHVMSPYSLVPPGDCIIIEMDEEKEKTDRICESYRVAIVRGELNGS